MSFRVCIYLTACIIGVKVTQQRRSDTWHQVFTCDDWLAIASMTFYLPHSSSEFLDAAIIKIKAEVYLRDTLTTLRIDEDRLYNGVSSQSSERATGMLT